MNPIPRKYQSGRMLWIILVAAVTIVMFATLTATLFSNEEDPAQTVASAEEARAAALTRDHAPTFGSADAQVHIVEFIDPACETCALFYPVVKQWMNEAPGKIRLSVRHVPFHRGVELAIRVLEASREQDLYWETLEALLASQAQWTRHHTVMPERVLPAVAGVGLDLDRIKADLDKADIEMRMEQDKKDAVTLQVRATPQYFVNGRELVDFGFENLAALIRDELAKAERAD